MGPDIPRSFESGSISSGYWGENISPNIEGAESSVVIEGALGYLGGAGSPPVIEEVSPSLCGGKISWVIASQDSGVHGLPGYWGGEGGSPRVFGWRSQPTASGAVYLGPADVQPF